MACAQHDRTNCRASRLLQVLANMYPTSCTCAVQRALPTPSGVRNNREKAVAGTQAQQLHAAAVTRRPVPQHDNSCNRYSYCCKSRSRSRQSAHERGFSFLPLNRASRDTPATLTTCTQQTIHTSSTGQHGTAQHGAAQQIPRVIKGRPGLWQCKQLAYD